MQISGNYTQNISNPSKYSTIYPDTIQRLGETEKVYEMNEKSTNNKSTEQLCDVDMSSEKTFMLDEEPTIPEDDDGGESGDDFVSIKVSVYFLSYLSSFIIISGF